jgi:outer membrane protein
MMLRYMRMFGVLTLVVAVTISPVAPAYGQQVGPQQGQQTGQQQSQGQQQQQTQPPPPAQPKKITDQSQEEYSHGKKAAPNLLAPYSSLEIPMPNLANSAKLQQFIREGKLYLGLQDCVALALENNMDIQVQLYFPWISDTNILSALSGAGTPVSFDPRFTSATSMSHQNQPISNPFTSGAGAGVTAQTIHTVNQNFTYNQSFVTGTTFQVTEFNQRTSSTAGNRLNPFVQSTLNVSIQQSLLNGFGLVPNTRFIKIARNNRQISDLQFQQLVITTITNVEDDYWSYVFTIKNIEVAQQSLKLAQTQFESNQKQEQIGTMAPLDVITAKAQVASATSALIQAQTARLQSEVVLLSVISKNPLAQGLSKLEIVPTDDTFIPQMVEDVPLDEAVREALTNRPDYKQFQITLNSDDINIRASRNALLPSLTAFGQYGWTGLAGIQTANVPGSIIPNLFVANLNSPVVTAGGVVVPGEFAGIPATTPSTSVTTITGLNDALYAIATNQFPSYVASLTLSVPIRNRSAQASNIAAILQQREDTAALQREQNVVVVDVHQAQIQLEQARAVLASAIQARELQQQSLDAENKKFLLGTSSTLLVIQVQNALSTAAGQEVQARVSLVEAKVNFDRALGRTLTGNNIQIADAGRSGPPRDTLIPGTRANGDLLTDNPNK